MSATLVKDSGHPDAQDNAGSLRCDLRGCTSQIGIWTGDNSLAGHFEPYVLVSTAEVLEPNRFCVDDAAWLAEIGPSIAAVVA